MRLSPELESRVLQLAGVAPVPLADLTEEQFQAEAIRLAKRNGWRVASWPPRVANHNDPAPTAEPKSGLGESRVGSVVCDLELVGEPFSKNRPRVVGKRAFTPKKTTEAEEGIRVQLLAAGVRPDADHTLGVRLVFRAATGQRKDIDNMVKLVLDACNGFAWRDDVQVEDLHATLRRRSDDPGTHLTVTRIGRYSRDCRWCGIVIPNRVSTEYCGRACYDLAQQGGGMVFCPECGLPAYRKRGEESKAMFCCRECSDLNKTGKRAPRLDDGWVDLALVRAGEFIVIELLGRGQIQADRSAECTELLRAAGVRVCVWRPENWAEIERVLTGEK